MGDAGARKILIVDDDPDIVESLKMALEAAGYATASAGNAEEGLEKVHAERPDLIVLDVMMPAGTEGFHFVWDLRKDDDPALRDLPIIMLTAIHQDSPMKFYPEQSDGTYQPYEYLPVQAFLDKPVVLDKLLAEAGRLLGEGEAAS
jgi:CheY-like chemotaxis protein